MDVNYFENVTRNNAFQFKYNLGQGAMRVGGGGEGDYCSTACRILGEKGIYFKQRL